MPVQLEGFSPELKRKVVYREVYQPELTDPEQAEAIVQATGKDEKIGITLADPSMWTAARWSARRSRLRTYTARME